MKTDTVVGVMVPAAWLQAVDVFTSGDDYRAQLCGAVLVTSGDAVLGAVATDSYVLGAVGGSLDDLVAADGAGDVFISGDVLAAVRKWGAGETVAVRFGDGVVTVSAGGVSATVPNTGIDGEFPDWRRLVVSAATEDTTDSVCGFNLDKVGQFAKAHKLVHRAMRASLRPDPVARITPNGGRAARVAFAAGDVNVSGLLMPCRMP